MRQRKIKPKVGRVYESVTGIYRLVCGVGGGQVAYMVYKTFGFWESTMSVDCFQELHVRDVTPSAPARSRKGRPA